MTGLDSSASRFTAIQPPSTHSPSSRLLSPQRPLAGQPEHSEMLLGARWSALQRQGRRAVHAASVAVAVLTLALGATQKAAAQERGRVGVSETSLDSIARRVEFMSPRSGPPGTVVTLRSTNMPAVTPVRIAVGALRFGFEEVAQVMTSDRGVLSTTVEVPQWAQRDLIHRFIVFDFYFVPIALSDIFHVTDSDGMVLRRGQLTNEGVECPALRGDDGVLYTLIGDIAEFEAGDEVTIEGTLPDAAICMQGTTIQVARIRAGRAIF